MNGFVTLCMKLDATRSTHLKLDALKDYFRSAEDGDAAWALYYLMGNKPRRLVSTTLLREWVADAQELPLWLVEETYEHVGDLAECLAALWPQGDTAMDPMSLKQVVETELLPLAKCNEQEKRERLSSIWSRFNREERFLFNKLITGGFRMGVGRSLSARALAELAELEAPVMEQRLMGAFSPDAASYRRLFAEETEQDSLARPYPFFLAKALDKEPQELGPVEEWQAEWKWDGIRAQLLWRGGQFHLWSRGEEQIGERFPELETYSMGLPDGTVLDGELLAWDGEAPMSFQELSRRVNRQKPGKKILRDIPVLFMVYDLLEAGGEDLRALPLRERRQRLLPILGRLGGDRFRISETLQAQSWEQLAELRSHSREQRVEGLMLKRLDSPYGSGRRGDSWWKWKVDPFRVDAVLLYAQAGHGRRAGLYTDYTFGLWKEGELLPFAKAYSGLSDEELKEVDRFIRKHTVERFGPVRQVEPHLVVELAFEGLQASKRHKSGVAVRFPRIIRIRHDKSPAEADHIEELLNRVT